MILAPCLALMLLGMPADEPALARAEDWPKLGAEVVATIRGSFFDARRAEEWAARNENYATGLVDRRAFVEATRRVLGELGSSHMGYYTVDDPQYYGLRSIFREYGMGKPVAVESIGVDSTPDGFVRVIFAGGPAERSGLRRGDQIVEADGAPFHPVGSLRGRSSQVVSLGVRDRAGGPLRRVDVVPRRIEPHIEWTLAQQKGARVVERNGKRLAYMPLFSAAGEVPEQAVRLAIATRFAEADALVLDLRWGWGGASPSFLDLFSRTAPDLEMITQDGVPAHVDARWRKPLVLVINEGSRSGKEMVAYAVQRNKFGTLVGTRTAGAVVGGGAHLLADGSLLFHAVADVHVDGHRLEGVGVSPDVEVPDALPFAEGRDPQMERALDVAAELAARAPR